MWKWETENEAKGVAVIVHDLLEHHEYYDELTVKLRRDGYHVIIGDLPGHGQTTRVNKGHINSFDQYIERVTEWHNLARQYDLPTFIIGQGLGGLIALEAHRQNRIQSDGIIALNPLLSFKQSFMNRKNTILTSVRVTSDESRFNLGIKMNYFTEDKRFLQRYKEDELIVDKVSFQWYKTIINQMKVTSENMEEVSDVPILTMMSSDNQIINPYLSSKYIKRALSDDFRFVMLNSAEHSIFQRENIEQPYYLMTQFLNAQLFSIGIIPE
ncbi:Phospholipase YtpA [Jeotgalicoccus aerolatus]|uniref:Alpha-beta hydrolase superfamily lysophospholipase n=1 Tax=Jeotgalicoccus aerolatus TaxID=709510 RepID=A0A1G9BK57_9STAP|nr:alpha/beta hydrolase [Jeotgalicoccus aerolatus]MBP1952591.1 alpha-beta hydrolase superfamily lysophospholipase [Jeotgalicoccus aerolatus]NMA80900.1 alpha/beta hydrolase [Jeotgalicoccus aerolatus]CAD2074321.1 Phospholipase YtpA [Jeotgalicoccus aerolatus]SDK39650.1 Lysophospholipase, alpha-beta hydrolase superfamily [Jeotgalicoccus aerolatus]GGD92488.1 lysophospholipase [Jeotgalicoccus aerolatus]